jgi:hypothetical protein
MSTNQTIKSHATTREYVENYQRTDMAKAELGRYCEGCGRLPAWCECPEGIPGARIVGMMEIVAALSNPMHGFADRDGTYHPAPGYNVIGKNL